MSMFSEHVQGLLSMFSGLLKVLIVSLKVLILSTMSMFS